MAEFKKKTFKELFGIDKAKRVIDNIGIVDHTREYSRSNGNVTDFEYGLRAARPHDDPMEFASSSGRDLDKKIREARFRMDTDRENAEARQAAIRKNIELVREALDREESDQISGKIRGYNICFCRVPVEDGKTDIRINHKKAYVHGNLAGDEIRDFAGKTEVSRDLITRAFDDMALSGTDTWERGLDSGNSVKVDVVLKAGRSVVEINNNLSGSDTLEIPGGKAVSRTMWENAYRIMQSNEKKAFAETLEDGTVIEYGLTVEVNGKPAMINEEKTAPMVETGRDFPGVSREELDRMYGLMAKKGTMQYARTLPDGTVITARLNVRVNGERALIRDDVEHGTVKTFKPVTQISREKYDEMRDMMIRDPRMSCRLNLGEGTVIDGKMDLRVNGEPAVPNIPFREGEVREERGYYIIAEDVWSSVKKEMDEKNATIFKKELPGGEEIRVKRDDEIVMITAGGDGKRKFYRERDGKGGEELGEAIAEVSGMNTDTAHDAFGAILSAMEAQGKLMAERQLASTLFGTPGKAIGSMKQQAESGEKEAESIGGGAMNFIKQGASLGR